MEVLGNRGAFSVRWLRSATRSLLVGMVVLTTLVGCGAASDTEGPLSTSEEEIIATPNVAWVARHGLTPAQYQAEFNNFVSQGYRLTDVSAFAVGGAQSFAAIWERSAAPAWVARHGLTSAQYQAEFNNLVSQGYRLILVEGYEVNGTNLYAAIWDRSPAPGAWVARHGLTSAQYQAEFNNLVGQGYRLVHVSGYSLLGSDRYAAIWERSAGPAWVARHGLTSAQYQAEFNNLVGQGFRLALVDGYNVAGVERFAAIWDRAPSAPWVARHGLSSAQYQAEFNNLVGQGYRLVLVSGYSSAAGDPRYAAVWRKP